jgi:hypothetical protein
MGMVYWLYVSGGASSTFTVTSQCKLLFNESGPQKMLAKGGVGVPSEKAPSTVNNHSRPSAGFSFAGLPVLKCTSVEVRTGASPE